ncbi:MAG: hypothetical protein ACREGK_10595, partial [Geminicoccales bacterium]
MIALLLYHLDQWLSNEAVGPKLGRRYHVSVCAAKRLSWSCLLLLATLASATAAAADAPLQLRIAEGDVLNVLHQQ